MAEIRMLARSPALYGRLGEGMILVFVRSLKHTAAPTKMKYPPSTSSVATVFGFSSI